MGNSQSRVPHSPKLPDLVGIQLGPAVLCPSPVVTITIRLIHCWCGNPKIAGPVIVPHSVDMIALETAELVAVDGKQDNSVGVQLMSLALPNQGNNHITVVLHSRGKKSFPKSFCIGKYLSRYCVYFKPSRFQQSKRNCISFCHS